MDRLTTKSVLVRYKVGKKFFYKAAMSKKEMASEAVKTVAKHLKSDCKEAYSLITLFGLTAEEYLWNCPGDGRTAAKLRVAWECSRIGKHRGIYDQHGRGRGSIDQ